jgi:hypothetical protein
VRARSSNWIEQGTPNHPKAQSAPISDSPRCSKIETFHPAPLTRNQRKSGSVQPNCNQNREGGGVFKRALVSLARRQ